MTIFTSSNKKSEKHNGSAISEPSKNHDPILSTFYRRGRIITVTMLVTACCILAICTRSLCLDVDVEPVINIILAIIAVIISSIGLGAFCMKYDQGGDILISVYFALCRVGWVIFSSWSIYNWVKLAQPYGSYGGFEIALPSLASVMFILALLSHYLIRRFRANEGAVEEEPMNASARFYHAMKNLENIIRSNLKPYPVSNQPESRFMYQVAYIPTTENVMIMPYPVQNTESASAPVNYDFNEANRQEQV